MYHIAILYYTDSQSTEQLLSPASCTTSTASLAGGCLYSVCLLEIKMPYITSPSDAQQKYSSPHMCMFDDVYLKI